MFLKLDKQSPIRALAVVLGIYLGCLAIASLVAIVCVATGVPKPIGGAIVFALIALGSAFALYRGNKISRYL